MKHVEIPVGAIDANPHRDFARNPIRKDQVEKLVDSIGRTGFWDNVVVRQHPTKKTRYQLAYGHSRLEAVKQSKIKTVRLPVADLSDWDMYVAMVDENETQQEITPAIAFENVEVGVNLLEAAFDKIGKEGTEKQFYAALGRDVSADTTRFKLGKVDGHGFEQARNAYFNNEGLGRNWVARVLPGSTRSNTISEVLNSHYGKKREAAKRKEADAKKREASAKAKEARASKDREKAARLREEAKAAQEEADKLEAEARKIGGRSIAAEILLQFDTPNQMTDFAAAIKAAGVAKEHHAAAAAYIIKEEKFGKAMAGAVDVWWYAVSGQREADRHRQQKEQQRARFKKRCKDGNVKQFFLSLGLSIQKWTGELKFAAESAVLLDQGAVRDGLLKKLAGLEEQVQAIRRNLSADNDDDVIEGEFVSTNGRLLALSASDKR